MIEECRMKTLPDCSVDAVCSNADERNSSSGRGHVSLSSTAAWVVSGRHRQLPPHSHHDYNHLCFWRSALRRTRNASVVDSRVQSAISHSRQLKSTRPPISTDGTPRRHSSRWPVRQQPTRAHTVHGNFLRLPACRWQYFAGRQQCACAT